MPRGLDARTLIRALEEDGFSSVNTNQVYHHALDPAAPKHGREPLAAPTVAQNDCALFSNPELGHLAELLVAAVEQVVDGELGGFREAALQPGSQQGGRRSCVGSARDGVGRAPLVSIPPFGRGFPRQRSLSIRCDVGKSAKEEFRPRLHRLDEPTGLSLGLVASLHCQLPFCPARLL